MFFVVSFLCLLLSALNLGGQVFAWNSSTAIGLLVASIFALAGFIISEAYAALPIAPLHLFVEWKWRNVPIMLRTSFGLEIFGHILMSLKVSRILLFIHLFALVRIFIFCSYTQRAYGIQTFYFPILLQVSGHSPTISAVMVIPFLMMSSVTGTLTNHLVQKTRHIRLLIIIPLAILPVGQALMATLDQDSPLYEFAGYSILTGAAFGTVSLTLFDVAFIAE